MTESNLTNEISGRQFVITRDFDAPRELVWKAWTDPEHMAQWWGPKGFTMRTSKIDLSPGGIYHYGMRSPEGFEMWGKLSYREIVPPERLVFVVSFSDEEGGITRHPMSQTWPLEVLNTLTLTERDGVTTLRLEGIPLSATDEERQTFEAGFESMQKGFKGTLDQLAEFLAKKAEPTDEELVFTRAFDAPRELVFKAWTDPKHVAQWWGPHGFTNPVCELDVRPGGAIRIDMRGPDGTIYPMTGVYQEIVEPERLVFTSAALDEAGIPLFEVLNTVTLDEQDGKTIQTSRARVVKKTAGADQYLAGMEIGWTQSLERLTDHLAKA